MLRICIDRTKCIGCLNCVTSCIVSHGSDSSDARNRVVIDSENKNAPIFCRQCQHPECAYTCMTGAMKKNHQTGYIEYDEERCVSCYMCIMACPFGVLKSDSVHHKTIMKCDMCVHRSTDGKGNPRCVEKCPMSAITFQEVNL